MLLSLDLGIGMVRVFSYYYNKFSYNYADYNKEYGRAFNFGREWWSPYASIQAKRIISSRSKVQYKSSPFANTFSYVGVQLKFNSTSIDTKENTNSSFRFRETYQSCLMIGRQSELSKDGILVTDLYLGLGVISNYNLDVIRSKVTLGLRVGVNLLRINK